ncbi:hypothetical protein LNKW23_18500 [Paralimibaculum aggregatum]|uniref:Uncharacterized protein n=1 Tax=Paralimibaculum aggregatum TaxID=3036245 RepID=A0ABQ6LH66_9RHOB|nr:hypothetical protein LNKW23_18500 [Limibaculum sp. NKW23]
MGAVVGAAYRRRRAAQGEKAGSSAAPVGRAGGDHPDRRGSAGEIGPADIRVPVERRSATCSGPVTASTPPLGPPAAPMAPAQAMIGAVPCREGFDTAGLPTREGAGQGERIARRGLLWSNIPMRDKSPLLAAETPAGRGIGVPPAPWPGFLRGLGGDRAACCGDCRVKFVCPAVGDPGPEGRPRPDPAGATRHRRRLRGAGGADWWPGVLGARDADSRHAFSPGLRRLAARVHGAPAVFGDADPVGRAGVVPGNGRAVRAACASAPGLAAALPCREEGRTT